MHGSQNVQPMIIRYNNFGKFTLDNRLPKITRDVLKHHSELSGKRGLGLEHLLRSLSSTAPIGTLAFETNAPDKSYWMPLFRDVADKSWQELEFMKAESFFYRILLENFGYYGKYGDKFVGRDPFLPNKLVELRSERLSIAVQNATEVAEVDSQDNLAELLRRCVWGNLIDLSYMSVAERATNFDATKGSDNLIVDASESVIELLSRARQKYQQQGSDITLHFVEDNAGVELATHVTLADFLLRHGWAHRIFLHLKPHPTFVSDATIADYKMLIDQLNHMSTNGKALAQRLTAFENSGRLKLMSHPFWNFAEFYRDLPADLIQLFSGSPLVSFFGDLNFRKATGDSQYLVTTPLDEVCNYFPTAMMLLRILKSDAGAGLTEATVQALNNVSKNWRHSGKFGEIRLVI